MTWMEVQKCCDGGGEEGRAKGKSFSNLKRTRRKKSEMRGVPGNEKSQTNCEPSCLNERTSWSSICGERSRLSDHHPMSIFGRGSASTAFKNGKADSNQTSTASISPLPSWLLFLLIFSWNLSSTSSFCPPSCSCDDVTLSVDCHHSASNLRVVPIFLNPQVKFLSLSRNEIKDITMSLQFYSELHTLDISHNKLDSLGKSNFESLKHLHLLNVSYNAIKELDNGVFSGLAHLRRLDLSGNQLVNVERKVFWGLRVIREIILDKNRLESLDWEVFRGLDALERISAKFNFITVLEPSATFSLTNGGSFGGELSKSNLVNSSSNVEVGGFWSLKNLHYLDMSSNQLTRVKDYGLVMFGALTELNLCSNYIHTLEENAFFISSIAGGKKPNGHLERLNLSQNRLGSVPSEALAKVGSTLRQLDLSSNRISDHISKSAFSALVQLESLKISDNPEVLFIDGKALAENSNLINFEADYLSNVSEISATLLKNKMFLENFSLKYASISNLSPEFFHPPISDIVGCLDLTGNPIDCNCSAHSFYEFVAHNLGESYPSSSFPLSPYSFDKIDGNGGIVSNPNEDQVQSSKSASLFAPNSNPNLIDEPTTPSQSKKSNKNSRPRPNLLYVRCQSPSNLGGVLVKDLKSSDFEHCFQPDDKFQLMVILIAGGLLSLILLTLTIKLCCVCEASRKFSSFCKTHNCCHALREKRKEKEQKAQDKLFFDSMTIALRNDLGPNLNNGNHLQNGKSIVFIGNSADIPLAPGLIIERTATLGRNGNNQPYLQRIDYSDCYETDDDDEEDDEQHHLPRQNHYERSYAPIERPPPIPNSPIPFHFPNQVQSLSRKSKQVALHHLHSHQHHSPTITHSPKHYAQHNIHNSNHHHHPLHLSQPHSPKHSQQQRQGQPNPPVILHYEYPDFPSMQRVKQVPSLLV